MSITVMSQVWTLDLPQHQAWLLMAYADWADDDGRCWPSNEHIAWKTGLSDRQVQRVKQELMLAGTIVIEHGELGGRGHTTHIRLDFSKVPRKAPFQKGVKMSSFQNTKKGDVDDVKGDVDDAKRETPMSPDTLRDTLGDTSFLSPAENDTNTNGTDSDGVAEFARALAEAAQAQAEAIQAAQASWQTEIAAVARTPDPNGKTKATHPVPARSAGTGHEKTSLSPNNTGQPTPGTASTPLVNKDTKPAKGPKTPTPAQELYDALMVVCNLNRNVPQHQGRVRAAIKQLLAGGYSAEHVLNFGRWWPLDKKRVAWMKHPDPQTLVNKIEEGGYYGLRNTDMDEEVELPGDRRMREARASVPGQVREV